MNLESNIDTTFSNEYFWCHGISGQPNSTPTVKLSKDQYCSEPEPLVEQFARAGRNSGIISHFREKYPHAYKVFVDNQKRELIQFIKGYEQHFEVEK